MRPRSEAGNQSPISDATSGPAAAVTAPRHSLVSSNSPNEDVVALHSMAPPQVSRAKPRIQVRLARSASTPNGSEKAAATSAVTETSSPMSVLSMCRACRSSTAAAPTVAVSALARASTQAMISTTLVRAGPPTATTSCLRAATLLRRTDLATGRNTRDRRGGG